MSKPFCPQCEIEFNGQLKFCPHEGADLFGHSKDAFNAKPSSKSRIIINVITWMLLIGIVLGYGGYVQYMKIVKSVEEEREIEIELALVKAYELKKEGEEKAEKAKEKEKQRLAEDRQRMRKEDLENVKKYRKAAAKGDADAQNNLGIMYQNGRGVEKDILKAWYWYRKAADQGNESAKENLLRLR